jgi:CheY-like chemotaxis protein
MAVLLVALTGYGQEEDRRKSQEAGFDRHMVKPVDPVQSQTLHGSLARGRVVRPSLPVSDCGWYR